MRARVRAFAVVVVVAFFAGGALVGSAPSANAQRAAGLGYELVGADGGVFAFAPGTFSGSLAGRRISGHVVAALDATVNYSPDEGPISGSPGYLLVTDTGAVYPFGLQSLGELRGRLNAPIVAAAAVVGGYFLVGADGGVFTYGTARFAGSLAARRLPAPIVAIAVTATGRGYWLVDAAGRVYPFGDAHFYGDISRVKHGAPVVGIAGDTRTPPTSPGYLLATADGKVFAFGGARSRGDASALRLHAPIAGIVEGVGGYYLFATDGGVFGFGVPFQGSVSSTRLNRPVVAMLFQLRLRRDSE